MCWFTGGSRRSASNRRHAGDGVHDARGIPVGPTPPRSVVEQLLALNVHHLFVSDAAGVIVGVISPVDVLRKLA